MATEQVEDKASAGAKAGDSISQAIEARDGEIVVLTSVDVSDYDDVSVAEHLEVTGKGRIVGKVGRGNALIAKGSIDETIRCEP